MIDAALLDTRRAFDSVAADYHRSNEGNPILRAMRRRTIGELIARVKPGHRILDLGCGPGTDDQVLAQLGYSVTAIDWSPEMVAQARVRLARAQMTFRVEVQHLGIHELDRLAPATFDAAYSNFGPLNCVPSLEQSARLIADRLRSGGVLVASVIGRVCPWEIALFTWRRDMNRWRIRYAAGPVRVPLNGETVWMRYYTPSAFVRTFRSAGFECVALRALGLFVPPPYMESFARRHPVFVDRLQRAEDCFGGFPGLRNWGDHFLIVLQKP